MTKITTWWWIPYGANRLDTTTPFNVCLFEAAENTLLKNIFMKNAAWLNTYLVTSILVLLIY